MNFEGIVKARIVQAKFATSGKIIKVNKSWGERVSRSELIAALDRKTFQAQLDKELADYEKVRSGFEIFSQKYPNPTEIVDKYLKSEKQATLNASVKEVELAKAALDQCDLFSPVEGIILDDSSIVPGIYVTPASSIIQIIDTSSFYLEVEIKQSDVPNFKEVKDAKVNIEGVGRDIPLKTSTLYSMSNKFFVKIPLTNLPGIYLGMIANVEV